MPAFELFAAVWFSLRSPPSSLILVRPLLSPDFVMPAEIVLVPLIVVHSWQVEVLLTVQRHVDSAEGLGSTNQRQEPLIAPFRAGAAFDCEKESRARARQKTVRTRRTGSTPRSCGAHQRRESDERRNRISPRNTDVHYINSIPWFQERPPLNRSALRGGDNDQECIGVTH